MTVAARAARYQELVEQAAKQLGCHPDSELAQHVGTLRLARETFAARLISGVECNPADLCRLDDALRQYLPVTPAKRSEPLHLLVARQRKRMNEILARPLSEREAMLNPRNGGIGDSYD